MPANLTSQEKYRHDQTAKRIIRSIQNLRDCYDEFAPERKACDTALSALFKGFPQPVDPEFQKLLDTTTED